MSCDVAVLVDGGSKRNGQGEWWRERQRERKRKKKTQLKSERGVEEEQERCGGSESEVWKKRNWCLEEVKTKFGESRRALQLAMLRLARLCHALHLCRAVLQCRALGCCSAVVRPRVVQRRWLGIYVGRVYGLSTCGDRPYGLGTLCGRDKRHWIWAGEA